jgi:hypothetical protein
MRAWHARTKSTRPKYKPESMAEIKRSIDAAIKVREEDAGEKPSRGWKDQTFMHSSKGKRKRAQ